MLEKSWKIRILYRLIITGCEDLNILYLFFILAKKVL